MTTPLETVGIVVGIAGVIVPAVYWLVRGPGRRPGEITAASGLKVMPHFGPREFSLFPLSFDVVLDDELPKVTVTALAMNFLNKPLESVQANVSWFQVNEGPPLEGFTTIALDIGPREFREVYLKKELSDAQVRAFGKVPRAHRYPYSGTIRLSATAFQGKKPQKCDTAHNNWAIRGHVAGLEIARAMLERLASEANGAARPSQATIRDKEGV
jgi:hypothetical protein